MIGRLFSKPEKESEQLLVVVIDRGEIEAGAPRETFATLQQLISTADNIKRYKEKIEIKVSGYDNDSRELWEIVEVRTFIDKLDRAFPYWLYFLTKEGTGLQFIIRCFLLPHLTPEAEKKINNERLVNYLKNIGFPAMNHLCMIAQLSEDEIEDLTNGVTAYLIK